jgi:hypothetical protein
MTADKTERDWVSEIGKPAYESLAEMVAALECDYDRLEELRDARDDLREAVADADRDIEDADGPDEITAANNAKNVAALALSQWVDENADELKELEGAAGECESQDEARERIEEDPLSVEVRSDWTTPGEEMTPAEFCILLGTGGPATRIVGELDEHGEPSSRRAPASKCRTGASPGPNTTRARAPRRSC